MLALLTRLERFYAATGIPGVVVAALVLLALVVLAVMGRRWWLLAPFLIMMVFSGHTSDTIDSGSTLVRWLIMFLLAATAAYGVSYAGAATVLLAMMAIWGILMSSSSVSPFYSLQQAGLLFILAGPMAAAFANSIHTRKDILKFLNLLLVAAGLFLILGLASVGQLRGARFSGALSKAPLFVITAGIFMPITLWGALAKGPNWKRVYCGCLFCGLLVLCFISGQRTGTFAGLVSCVPLAVARLGIRKIFVVLLVGLIGLVAVSVVLDYMPEQKAFVIKRFTSADTTGRLELWRSYYHRCMDAPFTGHGVGATGAMPMGPHNAFLAIWYEQGPLGLLLFSSAMVVLTWQSIRLLIRSKDDVVREMVRLCLGLMLGSIAAAFFEAKLNSPSNFSIFMVVSISIALTRLRAERVAIADVEPDQDVACRQASWRAADMLLVQRYDG